MRVEGNRTGATEDPKVEVEVGVGVEEEGNLLGQVRVVATCCRWRICSRRPASSLESENDHTTCKPKKTRRKVAPVPTSKWM